MTSKLIALHSSYCSTSLTESNQHPYFASVADKAILEDDFDVRAYQGEKKPDRVIGLAPCNRAYIYPGGQQRDIDIHHQDIRELKLKKGINLSPFKNGDFSTLILPFVILEAKNAYGTYWPELETQTGLPVAKLLKLQLNLQLATGARPSGCKAVVWMFGAIGPEWHVYGCYANQYKGEDKFHFVSFYSCYNPSKVGMDAYILPLENSAAS